MIILAILLFFSFVLCIQQYQEIKQKEKKIFNLEDKLSRYTQIQPCYKCGSTRVYLKSFSINPLLKCRSCGYTLSNDNINHSNLWLIRKWNKLYYLNRFKLKQHNLKV
jgi:predicted Zn-ribbon and HTH transcriptional regulator